MLNEIVESTQILNPDNWREIKAESPLSALSEKARKAGLGDFQNGKDRFVTSPVPLNKKIEGIESEFVTFPKLIGATNDGHEVYKLPPSTKHTTMYAKSGSSQYHVAGLTPEEILSKLKNENPDLPHQYFDIDYWSKAGINKLVPLIFESKDE